MQIAKSGPITSWELDNEKKKGGRNYIVRGYYIYKIEAMLICTGLFKVCFVLIPLTLLVMV